MPLSLGVLACIMAVVKEEVQTGERNERVEDNGNICQFEYCIRVF